LAVRSQMPQTCASRALGPPTAQLAKSPLGPRPCSSLSLQPEEYLRGQTPQRFDSTKDSSIFFCLDTKMGSWRGAQTALLVESCGIITANKRGFTQGSSRCILYVDSVRVHLPVFFVRPLFGHARGIETVRKRLAGKAREKDTTRRSGNGVARRQERCAVHTHAQTSVHWWGLIFSCSLTCFKPTAMVKAGKFYCHYEAAEVTMPFVIEPGLTFATLADSFCAKYNAKHGAGPGKCATDLGKRGVAAAGVP